VRPAELRGKRFIGYHSWQYRRRYIHRPEILEALVTDLVAHQPDHVALTGDLINLSLKAEYRAAAKWLEAFGDPEWITFVPGNHDAYVPTAWDTGLGLWSDYMTGDMRVAGAHNVAGLAAPFPFVRQRGQRGADRGLERRADGVAHRRGAARHDPDRGAARHPARSAPSAGCSASC
jgi:hypothetical protein